MLIVGLVKGNDNRASDPPAHRGEIESNNWVGVQMTAAAILGKPVAVAQRVRAWVRPLVQS